MMLYLILSLLIFTFADAKDEKKSSMHNVNEQIMRGKLRTIWDKVMLVSSLISLLIPRSLLSLLRKMVMNVESLE